MELELTQSDRQGHVIATVTAYFEARIEILRKTNDNTMSLEDTARVRGRIAECKRFLDSLKAVPAGKVDENGAYTSPEGGY